MAAQPQKALKGTVLCLHGFAQNGNVFSVKASGIRKALKKAGYHTVFIDSPLALTAADLPFEASRYGADDKSSELDFRGWVYTQQDRFDMQPAFETVKSAYKEHGPFVGLLGFSQGAGVVGLLLAHYNEIMGDDKALDSLKFAILYSGFKFEHESVQKYYNKRVTVPTLHVMGELDTLVSNERSQIYADLCDNHTVLKHPGGHYTPSTKDLLRSQIAWVSSVAEPKDEDDDQKGDDDQDDSLDKLIDGLSSLGKA